MKRRVKEFYNNFLSLFSDEMVSTPDWAYTTTVYPTMHHALHTYSIHA